MSEAPLRATLKAGTGYDEPWLGVDANTPEELVERLNAISAAGVPEALVSAANVLKAINAGAPILADVTYPPQEENRGERPQGWGQQQTQAPAPTWATGNPQGNAQSAPQQQRPAGNHPSAQLHPEGTQCELPGCSNVLEFKKTQSGKAKWQCPEWRWQNGNPNGHGMEWVN